MSLGRLAQLVERHVYTVNVGGSNPSPPTIPKYVSTLVTTQSLFGIACLITFVLCGRAIMGLFPPRHRWDWIRITLLSIAVIASMIPLVFWDFQG